jgi:MFS family permease
VCTTSSTIEPTGGRTIVRRTDTDITIEPGARDVEILWSFFRKAALVLFGISLLASLASTALFMGYRLPVEAWRIVFILALVTLTITRMILIPGVLLSNVTSPHPEFLADDLQDEWRELQQRTISHPHILIVSASISALVYVWCIFYFGKLTNAMWFGWMPVGVAAIGMGLLLFAFARRTVWYNNRFYRTPTWIMLTAFAGFAAALFLGIHMTEQTPPTRSG